MSSISGNFLDQQAPITFRPKEANLNDEIVDDDMDRKEAPEQQKFMNLQRIDLHGLVDIFDSYATKKTYATSFFNLALVANNFTQLKQLTDFASHQKLGIANIIVLMFVCMSLLLQLVVGVALVFLAKNREFIDVEKRDQLIRSNNFVTLLVVAISVINVFINVFLNV